MRLAIINDYQKLAANAADWTSLPDGIAVDITHDRMPGGAEGARRLAPYDIVVTSREDIARQLGVRARAETRATA